MPPVGFPCVGCGVPGVYPVPIWLLLGAGAGGERCSDLDGANGLCAASCGGCCEVPAEVEEFAVFVVVAGVELFACLCCVSWGVLSKVFFGLNGDGLLLPSGRSGLLPLSSILETLVGLLGWYRPGGVSPSVRSSSVDGASAFSSFWSVRVSGPSRSACRKPKLVLGVRKLGPVGVVRSIVVPSSKPSTNGCSAGLAGV